VALHSAAWLIQREPFVALGGFDLRLPPALAGVDLCLRARRAGWRSLVLHAAPAPVAVEPIPAPDEMIHAAARFRERWGHFSVTWERDWEERLAPGGAVSEADARRPGPLRVFVDLARLWPGGANGGVTVLIRELLAAVRAVAGADLTLLLLIAPALAPEAGDFAGPRDEVWILPGELPARCPHQHARQLSELDVALPRLLQADVCYYPLGVGDYYAADIPSIAMVVDVVHRDFPATLPTGEIAHRDGWFDRVAHTSFRIQCISEWTRERMHAHFGVPRERMFVTRCAVHRRLPAPPAGAAKRPPVFLYPANAWAHKNHTTLLEAYARYRAKAGAAAWDLVLTGHRDAAMEALAARAPELGLDGHVHVKGLLPPKEYAALWAHTGALVFPSLHEGFGIPVLEAMAAGVPVIAGRIGAIPEIAGEACLYVDPRDPEAIAGAMFFLHSQPLMRAGLAAAGRARAAEFDLQAEAGKLLAAFRDAVAAFEKGGVSWRWSGPHEISRPKPMRPTPATVAELPHHVDIPSRWDNPVPLLMVRGWCFARDERVCGVLAQTDEGEWFGVHGLPRPDVATVFPADAAVAATSGFALRIPRPARTPARVALVAVLASGERRQFATREWR
jgi:glycosyltransferase involved in cell wall biosynthesis